MLMTSKETLCILRKDMRVGTYLSRVFFRGFLGSVNGPRNSILNWVLKLIFHRKSFFRLFKTLSFLIVSSVTRKKSYLIFICSNFHRQFSAISYCSIFINLNEVLITFLNIKYPIVVWATLFVCRPSWSPIIVYPNSVTCNKRPNDVISFFVFIWWGKN